jgi:tetratricopeptide (TPR) repeat protein
VTLVRGDASTDLFNQGLTFLQAEKYDDAAKAFDSIITNYPTSPNIDQVRIEAGSSFLQAGKYPEAIDRLAKEAGPSGKPEFRAQALYYTALAQFSAGQKASDKSQGKTYYSQSAATLTTLVGFIASAPTADNNGYLEQAIYYRALAEFLEETYDKAEKDLLQLIQQFPASLSRPDYYLRLGSLYALETNQAVTALNDARKGAKSPEDVAAVEATGQSKIKAAADQALNAFDQVSRDPNALVQANEANMSKAEVLFLIAQLDSTPAGYQKALDAFRQVRRKDDMVPLQQQRLDDLKKRSQQQLQNSPASSTLVNANSLLIGREENRLKDLKDGTDPIIQALIRMAECYVSMKEPDEARTILHRLIAHASLTPDQQQEVDFQILYSYVLGGQLEQADKALDDYLGKHGGDPQADSISLQMAQKLMERKDYAGSLSQATRSLKDFPKGRFAADAVALKAQALNRLGRIPEADQVVNDFLAQNPTSPVANQMFLTKAQGETSRADFTSALADYKKVKDNASASPELRAGADAGYIQTLNSLMRYDDVLSEAKSFESQYPQSPALPSVLLFAGMAMDQKHDPGAVAALQDLARKYPKDEAAPFALFYVVNIYERQNNAPAMIQAAADFRTAFPQSYTFLAQAADAVSTVLLKEKKFDDAIALYQPLTQCPQPDVAASARNKIGAVWLASAKSLGYYQSMGVPARADAEKRLSTGEKTYLDTLENSPGESAAVGEAFDGLVNAAKQRRSWGLLKDADMEAYFTKLGADLTTPEMQARLEMAKAGLVFIYKDGAKQYPAALDRFKKVIAANPDLRLTRQETVQFGELLLAAKDYPTALKTYNDLLTNTSANDQAALGDAYYGLGATYLGQGDIAQAKVYFLKLKALPGGGAWHQHILDANFGVALADEQSGQPADIAEAQGIYGALMQAPQGGVPLQAKAMLGYGRLLEKAGHGITPAPQGPNEFAVHYYQEPHLLFGPATPEQSAEGLYDAGQVYGKAGDKANAKKQYDDLIKAYSATAPEWAAKAQAAEAQP